jgi:hypothetical protein
MPLTLRLGADGERLLLASCGQLELSTVGQEATLSVEDDFVELVLSEDVVDDEVEDDFSVDDFSEEDLSEEDFSDDEAAAVDDLPSERLSVR